MYWTEFAGQRLPKPVGGHAAVDFCNTYAGWNGPGENAVEYLTTYEHLAAWTTYAGLITAEQAEPVNALAREQPEEAARVLAEAQDLRTTMYAILLEPSAGETFAHLAAYIREAADTAELVADAEGIAHWAIPANPPDLGLPLRLISHVAGELLCSPDRTLVRACPGHDCGWLFLDRRGRRRWCSMATCGNRAKVRAFEARQKAG